MSTEPPVEDLFPCAFPVKVMGAAVPEFRQRVQEIVRHHAPEVQEGDFTARSSRGGRYCALTVVVQARSREHMDALYRDLSACELVTMTL